MLKTKKKTKTEKEKKQMTKKLFLQFVALAEAQAKAKDAADQLQALKDSDSAAAADNALTDEENQQVQQALNLISAANPPSPEAVNSIAANVEQATPAASEQTSAAPGATV